MGLIEKLFIRVSSVVLLTLGVVLAKEKAKQF